MEKGKRLDENQVSKTSSSTTEGKIIYFAISSHLIYQPNKIYKQKIVKIQ